MTVVLRIIKPRIDLIPLVVAVFNTVMVILTSICLLLLRSVKSSKSSIRIHETGIDDEYIIRTIDQLRNVVPIGLSGSCLSDAPKVLNYLDEQMIGFICQSNFVHLATFANDGTVLVSPKGDAPGFVEVVNSKLLILPDRPGNNLIFGLQNIVENSNIGLLFQIPKTLVTLRVGGTAFLNTDPKMLSKFVARGVDATIVICIQIRYAFFQCAKAYIRSQIWNPQSWPQEPYKVHFGKYLLSIPLSLLVSIICE